MLRYLCLLIGFSLFLLSENYAQEPGSKNPFDFQGSVTVTSKGISTVPNLSLGKPAAIFEMKMGRRLTFEPTLRFSLEGRPWSFLFWGRYKLVQKEKFLFNVSFHPALSFRMQNFQTEAGMREVMTVYRFLAIEATPSYIISNKLSVGPYFLYFRGIEKEITRNTSMIALRAGISNIKIAKDYYFRINPQVYYLNIDGTDGMYLNATSGISKTDFPLAVTMLVSNPIKTDIPVGNEFLWNISLVYSFGK